MVQKLELLIADILNVPVDKIIAGMTREGTPEWDSLNHLRLVTAIESEYGITLTMDEIAAIQTPQQLQMTIDSKSADRD